VLRIRLRGAITVVIEIWSDSIVAPDKNSPSACQSNTGSASGSGQARNRANNNDGVICAAPINGQMQARDQPF
jgi:hypothetical protein